MEPAIRLRGVIKQYRDNFRLGPLDLEVEQGYVVAVIGPNGSGKSTLFHLLMNTVRPDEGDIALFGATYPRDEVALKRRIGFVPDTSHFTELGKTADDAVSFISHWYPSWDRRKYADLMRKFELDPKARFDEFSLGMQRRMALVIALSHHPDLLLMDEPSSGLDPAAWRTMLEEVSEWMRQEGKTTVIATHNMEEVRRLADFVLFLNRGQVLGFFEKDALIDEWKIFWVEGEEGPSRLVTRTAQATEEALRGQGIPILRKQSMELDEIFHELVRTQPAGLLSKERKEER